MTQLSVNVNKIAVLRNSRGGLLPDPVAGARLCVDAGCAGITVHPRPDRRHVHSEDVTRLAAMLAKDAPGVELNIEGNPFAPPREGYPGLLALAEVIRPAQCTLVPDGDGQLTSDHGFDLQRDAMRLAPVVAVLKRAGIRVSVFVDAGDCGFDAAARLGIDRVEIYTGPYADASKRGDADESLLHCRRTAEAARTAGLAVNAGHDLDQRNLGPLLAAIPWIAEVSIGHALIADALVDGLPATVRAYLRILKQAGTGA